MTDRAYGIPEFVADLRRISGETGDEREVVQRIRPLVKRLASDPDWLEDRHYVCDPEDGYGTHMLHEEADHSLAVMVASWLPNQDTPPHDHGTWAVVAGLDGVEVNRNWQRLDDGSRPDYAETRPYSDVRVGPGDVVAFLARDIHSVHSDPDQVSVSLHVYGKNPNFTERVQFDPDTKTVTHYKY